MIPAGRAALSSAASTVVSSSPAKPVIKADRMGLLRVSPAHAAPAWAGSSPLVGRHPAADVAGRLQLGAYTGSRVARYRWPDHGAVPDAFVAEVGFLHIGRLARQHVTILLLQVGKGLKRIHARFLRSEEHTSELQSLRHLVCRLLLEKKQRI